VLIFSTFTLSFDFCVLISILRWEQTQTRETSPPTSGETPDQVASTQDAQVNSTNAQSVESDQPQQEANKEADSVNRDAEVTIPTNDTPVDPPPQVSTKSRTLPPVHGIKPMPLTRNGTVLLNGRAIKPTDPLRYPRLVVDYARARVAKDDGENGMMQLTREGTMWVGGQVFHPTPPSAKMVNTYLGDRQRLGFVDLPTVNVQPVRLYRTLNSE
jgi:hypothetical protein